MHAIDPGDVSFKTFTDILTGYRLSALLRSAHASGLFGIMGTGGATLEEICTHTGWQPRAASRFLHALCRTGLLETRDAVYHPTPFSKTFLLPDSEHYQGRTLAFEQQLVESWEVIEETLKAGRRVYGIEDKDDLELDASYANFLGAMDEAAEQRAPELWDALSPQENGVILDIGAGSGRFLKEFLSRHSGWQGIFCDLPNVVAKACEAPLLSPLRERISFLASNYLDLQECRLKSVADRSCELVLLSNVVHCQSMEETRGLVQHAADKVSENGVLLIHDFFTDTLPRGALYDIHMLLNTYNGRTYSCRELIEMSAPPGLTAGKRKRLASGSELLAFARGTTPLLDLFCRNHRA